MLSAAAIVRNHTQLKCCSIVYVQELSGQDSQELPGFIPQKIALQHLRTLLGWEDAATQPASGAGPGKTASGAPLSIAHVLQLLLDLASPPYVLVPCCAVSCAHSTFTCNLKLCEWATPQHMAVTPVACTGPVKEARPAPQQSTAAQANVPSRSSAAVGMQQRARLNLTTAAAT